MRRTACCLGLYKSPTATSGYPLSASPSLAPDSDLCQILCHFDPSNCGTLADEQEPISNAPALRPYCTGSIQRSSHGGWTIIAWGSCGGWGNWGPILERSCDLHGGGGDGKDSKAALRQVG